MRESAKMITALKLKAALHDGEEIALLDAREEVPFDARHILMAACVPLGRLEIMLDDLVPRRSTRVVWCDDGEGLAADAAKKMLEIGYTDVSVLAIGIADWEAAGFRIYSGVHVPSKAFAEVVEHEACTPHITVQELKTLIDDNADIAIYDTRSFEEFNSNSIPGAVNVPGAEILYRFRDLTPSPKTMVVVNCGGRTRSIIGAQALINAGVPNEVVSLKNGTQDWYLAGYEVIVGATRCASAVSKAGFEAALVGARRVAKLCGINIIDVTTLNRWRNENEARTLYLLDIRTVHEYEEGHIAGVKHVAGGQLVQETDGHLGTWGARVVVVDDNGIRSTMTASWLKQMGWDVSIITNKEIGDILVSGPYEATILGLNKSVSKKLSPHELEAKLEAGTVNVVDLNWSRGYYEGHIPGSWYAIRSRLNDDLSKLPSNKELVFTSPNGVLAELAASDFSSSNASVSFLEGGTIGWLAAGMPLERGSGNMASAPDDIRLKAREQGENIEAAMRDYLEWEINLVKDMADDQDHRFKVALPVC